MQINLLKNLVEKTAGTASEPIVEILINKKDVNEFLIAKKMNMTINQIRNILYKLSAEGLVSFIRKKDKRKGWYIYFWTLDSKKCLKKIAMDLIKDIQDLEEKLRDREKSRFYVCKSCNIELTEERALEHDFYCEECAEIYELSDSTELIKEIANKILRKEKNLKNVNSEIAIIEEEETKNKLAKQRRNEKEKQIEKERKKLERKKEKEKLNKKNLEKESKKEKSPKKTKRKD